MTMIGHEAIGQHPRGHAVTGLAKQFERLSQNLDRHTDSGRIGVESRRFVTAF